MSYGYDESIVSIVISTDSCSRRRRRRFSPLFSPLLLRGAGPSFGHFGWIRERPVPLIVQTASAGGTFATVRADGWTRVSCCRFRRVTPSQVLLFPVAKTGVREASMFSWPFVARSSCVCSLNPWHGRVARMMIQTQLHVLVRSGNRFMLRQKGAHEGVERHG